jgi:hypothetical protein
MSSRTDGFTIAILPPSALSSCDIPLRAPLPASGRRRKATAVCRVLPGMSSCRHCNEGWKCGRFPADREFFLPSMRCGFFDQTGSLFRSGNVDGVTGSSDFDLMAVGSCGIPAFEVGVDGSV